MSCWRWHRTVATPLGSFPLEMRMDDPSKRPNEEMVRMAEGLARFVEASGENLLDVVFGEYRRAARDDPKWMKGSEVPLRLTRARMPEFVECSALVVERDQYAEEETYTTRIHLGPQWDEEHGLTLEVKGGQFTAINDLPFALVDGLVEYKAMDQFTAITDIPEPPALLSAEVVPLNKPPSPGHAAKRWLSEAEACGFVLLGWMKVTFHTTSTSVALANPEGSIVFLMYSRSFGGDFNPVGVEMCSYLSDEREVITSLFPVTPSDSKRRSHRHHAKVSTIGELLREHQSHLARLNIDLAGALRIASLSDLVAILDVE